MIREAIAKIIDRTDLTFDEARLVMEEIMRGEVTPAQLGTFLAALRMKEEAIQELAAFAMVMREHAIPLRSSIKDTLVDTCGTGGDGAATFNISTTAAFVTAGAGVPVVKHGNRNVSSRCGSADVLEALGVKIDVSPDVMRQALERYHIAFLFAPLYHPAMRHVMGARREIGVRTVFNLLGPLANPAGAQAQLIGVYHPLLTEKLVRVLDILGVERALVVYGAGIDEITTTGFTRVTELRERGMWTYILRCEAFGIPKAYPEDLRGGDAPENARITLEILQGSPGPARDVVILNAGAAIYLSGKAESIGEGVAMAADSIDSGRALWALDGLIQETGCVR